MRTILGAGLGVIGVAAAAYLGVDVSSEQPAETGVGIASTSSDCPIDTLPQQARHVVDTIETGGRLKYPDSDGSRFGNYERRLPEQARNYYREYTVDTPGVNHRGARRIVTGGPNARDPEVWYYTDDHYESFCTITGL